MDRTLPTTLTLLLLPAYFVFSQTITGQVFNNETNEIVPFANIYFNSTFKGTAANANGEFELEVDSYKGQAIVISSIGYESALIEEYKSDNFYRVMLKPKNTMLNEVVVEPDNMLRKRKERIFIEEFLGQSENARSCEIKNLSDIRLIYAASSDRLEAYSDNPIIIHNKALGYRIEYYLVKFTSGREFTHYMGNFFFEEIEVQTEKQREKIQTMRRTTYQGSRMHFFRSLWRKSFRSQGFRLSGSVPFELTYHNIVVEEKDQKFLTTELIEIDTTNTSAKDQMENAIRIHYPEGPSTKVILKTPRVLFNSNGYFDPEGISWSGKMANERIGDLLPFDYDPKE